MDETARNVWSIVSKMFAAAVADGMRPVNPCLTVEPPEKDQAEVIIPTPADVEAPAAHGAASAR